MRPSSACTICLLYLLPAICLGQVNTEKLRRADSATGAFLSAGISLGVDRGNTEFLSVAGGLRVDYVREANDNFVVAQYDFRESDKGKITNKGFLHGRTMWTMSGLLTLEGFGQSEFNEFISLKNRNLLGAGTRWHPLARARDDASLSLELFLGVGLMYEHEYYSTSPDPVVHDRLRSTNYLTLNAAFGESTILRVITYFQPVLSAPEDFRFSNETALEFKVSRWLTFSVTSSYRYNSRPVLNVKRYDLQLRNGILFTLP